MSRARLLVNEGLVETDAAPGRPLLDFLRLELGLTGTKEGCREGDCGACAVIIGEFHEGRPRYRAHPSCLAFVGELPGRHLLTIEGLAGAAEKAGLELGLTPVMRALLEENGSQCGFCSPGFVNSLTAWLLEGADLSEEGALRAIDGNLCRCTGYASIRRAARLLLADFAELPAEPLERFRVLVERGVVPASVLGFARGELGAGPAKDGGRVAAGRIPLGGGSDLAIKAPDSLLEGEPRFLRLEEGLKRISREQGRVAVGAAVSVRDFFGSPLVREALPGLEAFETRFASTLVRNRATVGGNLANASPVADLSPLFLALGARLRLEGPEGSRELALDDFFVGYRATALREGEILAALLLPPLDADERLTFEKLSKRENLDIASVNCASRFRVAEGGERILSARLAAGGVAATTIRLPRTEAFLAGKGAELAVALEAARLAASEIEPIGDVRGSAEYRREGLGRLVLAHLVALRPALALELEAALAPA